MKAIFHSAFLDFASVGGSGWLAANFLAFTSEPVKDTTLEVLRPSKADMAIKAWAEKYVTWEYYDLRETANRMCVLYTFVCVFC